MTMIEATAAYTKASQDLTAASASLHAIVTAHAKSQKDLEAASKVYTDAKAQVAAALETIEQGIDKPDTPVIAPVVAPVVPTKV